MKQFLITEALKLFLNSLSSNEFKVFMDTVLDNLEGKHNEKQKSWHIILRAMLRVPDND